jgi:hypothetical protein
MRSIRLLCAAMLFAFQPLHAQHGFWQPDDRVLITSFYNARGIATDQRLVFVATTNGLEVYDQTFRRWLPPSTIEDGYPAREVPARIAYDPRERGVWLVTEVGTVYAWSSAIQRWQQRFPSDVPADVLRRLQRGTAERDPAWAVMRNFAGRDATGRTWQVTAIDAAERAGTFWAATNGGNFSFVDTRNLSSEAYTFGTISRGVSALAFDGRNLWFGGDGASARNGVTRADTSLQTWQQFESRIADGPQGRVTALLATSSGTYAAAADGVYSLRRNRWQRVSDVDARALAHTSGRVWVAARGTLGWIDGTDNYQRVELPLQSINALAARNDSLWIAAETGLYLWANGSAQQLTTTPTFDVAVSDKHVVELTSRGLGTWAAGSEATALATSALRQIGRAVSLNSKADRVWVGGTAGIAEWNTTTGAWRYLTVADDIPEGPVFDVLEENGRLWLATPAGALRLNWHK